MRLRVHRIDQSIAAPENLRSSKFYQESLKQAGRVSGSPPVAFASDLAGRPSNMARYMAQYCDWLADKANIPGEEGDKARSEIVTLWRRWRGFDGRKNQAAAVAEFSRIIFDHAARTGHDPESLQRATWSAILAFGVTFPEFAAGLDDALVKRAILRASADARVDRGPSKWTAIAEAYNSSGDTTTAEAARKAFEAEK